jgi:hypothetical protein
MIADQVEPGRMIVDQVEPGRQCVSRTKKKAILTRSIVNIPNVCTLRWVSPRTTAKDLVQPRMTDVDPLGRFSQVVLHRPGRQVGIPALGDERKTGVSNVETQTIGHVIALLERRVRCANNLVMTPKDAGNNV